MLSSQEKGRYSRHIKLEGFGLEKQEKLKKAKILVIGAGGLGATALQYLVAAGIGHITILDADVVEESNLQRQIIFNTGDIGLPKVLVAQKKLQELNPYVTIEALQERFNTDNAITLCETHDVIVDGSDNFQTRYLVNDACVITNKPFVYASVFKYEGQVAVFNYKNGATYRCLFPTPPSAGDVPSCGDIGVLGVLPGLLGCYQANEVIKIVTQTKSVLSGKLLSINTLSMIHHSFAIERSEGADIIQLLDNYEAFCGVDFSTIKELEFDEIAFEEFQIIDIRDGVSFKKKHLTKAVNFPYKEITTNIKQISRAQKVLIYCQQGITSQQIIQYLQSEHEFTNLYSLKNGMGSL